MPIMIFVVGGVFLMASVNGTVAPLLDQANKDLFGDRSATARIMDFSFGRGDHPVGHDASGDRARKSRIAPEPISAAQSHTSTGRGNNRLG